MNILYVMRICGGFLTIAYISNGCDRRIDSQSQSLGAIRKRKGLCPFDTETMM
jgi:hypothetical protein